LIERNRGQVIGEKSFGAGTEQQLFSLRDGDGLLLTVVKWASASAKPFLGEDRSKSGITPSVEVKAPELADAVSPDDLSGNDDDAKPGQPAEKQTAAPDQKPVDDVQLKKALELLRENKPVAVPKAA
jgi:carboxyl-terminal processing protease